MLQEQKIPHLSTKTLPTDCVSHTKAVQETILIDENLYEGEFRGLVAVTDRRTSPVALLVPLHMQSPSLQTHGGARCLALMCRW